MVRQVVDAVSQVRAEYASARLILANPGHRVAGTRTVALPGALPADADPQAAEALDVLREPFGSFFDCFVPRGVAVLADLRRREGLPLPLPEAR